MKVGIYGKNFSELFSEKVFKIFEILNKNKIEIYVYKPFFEFIKQQLFFEPKIDGIFETHNDLKQKADLIFSIGGDGTFLETVSLVRNSQIPIVGVNSGRMGFLAYISKEELSYALEEILHGEFTIEKRTLIELENEENNNLFNGFNCALNEITVHKKDSSSMISMQVFINNEFLNTYWADGLIIATPTGSTAYSLSAGGPIVVPGSDNFIITPIAPHNLTVRPIVVSDHNQISLKVEGRSNNFLVSLDYRSEIFETSTNFKIKKADFPVKMIKLKNHNFFSTLRNKLMWGIDKRN